MVLCHQNHRLLTRLAWLSSMLKSKCKVFTLPVQRKQTPYASCPVIRKRFLSWYYYYTQSLENYQLVFYNFYYFYQIIALFTKFSQTFQLIFTFPIYYKQCRKTTDKLFHKKRWLSNLPMQQPSDVWKTFFPLIKRAGIYELQPHCQSVYPGSLI